MGEYLFVTEEETMSTHTKNNHKPKGKIVINVAILKLEFPFAKIQ